MSQQVDKIQKEQDSEVEIDLLEVFYYLKARLLWLIIAFVLGAVIFGCYTKLFITPLYQARAKLYMVSASSDSIVDLTDLNLGSSLTKDYEELLKIRPIYEDVIKELQLDYTYEELLSMVSVGTLNETRMLAITVTSPDPEEARDIANSLANKAVTYVPRVMETSTPHIAEKAIVPQKKSSPSLAKNTLIGAFLFAVVLAGIFVVQLMMDDTFKSAEDVEKVLGVMPLTIIPEGDMRTIDDNAEKEILAKKKKERRKKRKEQKTHESEE